MRTQLQKDLSLNGLSEQLSKSFAHAYIEYCEFLATAREQFTAAAIPPECSILRATCQLPLVLAEVFDETRPEIVHRASLAHFCFDAFVHSIDDLTDREPFIPEAVHFASQMQATAWALYVGLSNEQAVRFSKSALRFLNEAGLSERLLWRHKGQVVHYTDNDVTAMGTKSSTCKITAAYYAAASNRWELLSFVEQPLTRICTAIQILDDLMDWREDLSRRNYSYCLTETLLESSGDTAVEVADLLFASRRLRAILALAAGLISDSAKSFATIPAPTMTSLLHLLRTRIESCIRRIDADTLDANETEQLLRTILTPELGH